jgi:hypothetical protein
MPACHRCGTEWVPGDKRSPGFKETCTACDHYLHCCKNCRLYDPKMNNQCQSGTTERVVDKESMNFCDEFEFANPAQSDESTAQKDDARNALDALFGDEDEENEEDQLEGFRGL